MRDRDEAERMAQVEAAVAKQVKLQATCAAKAATTRARLQAEAAEETATRARRLQAEAAEETATCLQASQRARHLALGFSTWRNKSSGTSRLGWDLPSI